MLNIECFDDSLLVDVLFAKAKFIYELPSCFFLPCVRSNDCVFCHVLKNMFIQRLALDTSTSSAFPLVMSDHFLFKSRVSFAFGCSQGFFLPTIQTSFLSSVDLFQKQLQQTQLFNLPLLHLPWIFFCARVRFRFWCHGTTTRRLS